MAHYKAKIVLTDMDTGSALECEAEGYGNPVFEVCRNEPSPLGYGTAFYPFGHFSEESWTGVLELPNAINGFHWKLPKED